MRQQANTVVCERGLCMARMKQRSRPLTAGTVMPVQSNGASITLLPATMQFAWRGRMGSELVHQVVQPSKYSCTWRDSNLGWHAGKRGDVHTKKDGIHAAAAQFERRQALRLTCTWPVVGALRSVY